MAKKVDLVELYEHIMEDLVDIVVDFDTRVAVYESMIENGQPYFNTKLDSLLGQDEAFDQAYKSYLYEEDSEIDEEDIKYISSKRKKVIEDEDE